MVGAGPGVGPIFISLASRPARAATLPPTLFALCFPCFGDLGD